MVGSEPVDLSKTYRLCTIAFLANGKDGYSCLAECRMIVNEEDGPQLNTVVQNHFQSVSHLSGICKLKYNHHQSIISRCQRKSLSRQASALKDEESGPGEDYTDAANSGEFCGRRRWQKARIALAFARHRTIEEAETEEVKVALAPKVQQRINKVGDQWCCVAEMDN